MPRGQWAPLDGATRLVEPDALVSECVSAKGPKVTFDGSAQGKGPCEDDSSKGLIDGRVEGRIGVKVESEVVLKCEGYHKEGACDMLCLM